MVSLGAGVASGAFTIKDFLSIVWIAFELFL